MARNYSALLKHILLAQIVADQTASTSGTELTDARIRDAKSGVFYMIVHKLDYTTTDEAYQILLEGRDTSAGAYRTLATINLGAQAGSVGTVAGVYFANVDRGAARMRYRSILGGTTPIIQFTALYIAQESAYSPDVGTVIST